MALICSSPSGVLIPATKRSSRPHDVSDSASCKAVHFVDEYRTTMWTSILQWFYNLHSSSTMKTSIPQVFHNIPYCSSTSTFLLVTLLLIVDGQVAKVIIPQLDKTHPRLYGQFTEGRVFQIFQIPFWKGSSHQPTCSSYVEPETDDQQLLAEI